MIKIDLSNPIHADAFLITAGHFLTKWPTEWSAQTLKDIMAGEESEDWDDLDIILWEPFENDSMSNVLEWIEDATSSVIELLQKYGAELPGDDVITVRNKYLAFEGGAEDAIAFVDEIHATYQTAGIDMGKTLNDFVFSIEVALQNAGYMDEDFNVIAKEVEA